jgi:hypothetical protein
MPIPLLALSILLKVKKAKPSKEKRKMVTKDFDAHVTKRVPTRVKFETRGGKKVRFTAEKPKRVKTHVHFRTRKP